MKNSSASDLIAQDTKWALCSGHEATKDTTTTPPPAPALPRQVEKSEPDGQSHVVCPRVRTRRRIAGILAACTLLTGVVSFGAEAPKESPKDMKQLLQEGLFEEEASHDLGKAAAAYSTLVAKADADRALAATAIFRLAEVRSKQGKKDEAAALWQRIVTEFPSQAELVKLSRERLGGLGVANDPGSAEAPSDEEAKELQRLQDIAKNSPDLLWARKDGKSPLDLAASKGWLRVADYLLKQGAKVDEPNVSYNPLVSAAAEGHKTMVDFLLDHGADSKALGFVASSIPEYSGQYTALMAAIQNDRRVIINRLLERGANVNAGDKRGRTPLFIACRRGNLEISKLLLEKGANPNVAEVMDKNANQIGSNEFVSNRRIRPTALLLASRRAEMDLLKLLLERGAKPGLPSDDEACEIEDAIRNENLKALELLLPRVPKLTSPEPLLIAADSFNPEVLALVLRFTADLNGKGQNGYAPILEAARYQWLEGMSILLEAGATPKETDPEGKTPLHHLAALPLVPTDPPQSAFKRQQNTPRRPARATYQLPPRTDYGIGGFAFPIIGARVVENKPEEPTTLENAEWAKRKPLFETLLAKGADLAVRDNYGYTPFNSFLLQNCWSTDGVEWFVVKGADILTKGGANSMGDGSALAGVQDAMRAELARHVLLPKLEQPDTILVWGTGDSITEPFRFKRDAQHDTPPTLLELAGEPPGKPAPAKSDNAVPGTTAEPEAKPNSIQAGAALAVINRKDAEGKWQEAIVVRLVTPADKWPEQPKLQWGDAIFFCASTGGYRRDNLTEEAGSQLPGIPSVPRSIVRPPQPPRSVVQPPVPAGQVPQPRVAPQDIQRPR